MQFFCTRKWPLFAKVPIFTCRKMAFSTIQTLNRAVSQFLRCFIWGSQGKSHRALLYRLDLVFLCHRLEILWPRLPSNMCTKWSSSRSTSHCKFYLLNKALSMGKCKGENFSHIIPFSLWERVPKFLVFFLNYNWPSMQLDFHLWVAIYILLYKAHIAGGAGSLEEEAGDAEE